MITLIISILALLFVLICPLFRSKKEKEDNDNTYNDNDDDYSNMVFMH